LDNRGSMYYVWGIEIDSYMRYIRGIDIDWFTKGNPFSEDAMYPYIFAFDYVTVGESVDTMELQQVCLN